MDFSSRHKPRVCFFDSGIGGLNLLYECVRKLPQVNFSYFADNFNMPYGSLPQARIIEMTDAHFEKISKLNPAAAVIACNTVTAQCAEFLRKKYPFPIVGIQPAVKPAAEHGGKCVVLATPSTAASAAIKKLIECFGKLHCEVVPCPNLAAYIEQNIFNLDKDGVLSNLPRVSADSIVLGCTHYTFIKKYIEEYYGCPVYDGIDGTSNRLCQILGNSDHLSGKAENICQIVEKVQFIGGDAVKNAAVFKLLVAQSG